MLARGARPGPGAQAPAARLSSRSLGLLLLAGLGLGLVLGYHYFGRPHPRTPPELHPGEFSFLPPDGPFVPDRVYTTAHPPAGPEPPQPQTEFPEGVKQVFCYYDLPRVKSTAPLDGELYLDGRLLQRVRPRTMPGLAAKGFFTLSAEGKGLPVGIYEIYLRVGRDTVADTSFEVVPRPPERAARPSTGRVRIGTIQIALGVDAEGRPVSPAPSFPRTVRRLFACFEFAGAAPGQKLVCHWSFAGVLLPQFTTEIELHAEQGRAYGWIELGRRSNLLVGKYEISILDGNKILGKTTLLITP